MNITPFKLERYFAEYEFKVRYLLSPSDCESLTLTELLAMQDSECRGLWENLSLSYTESQGHPELRTEISHLYESISADQVLVAAPEEAIFILMNSLLRPGDQVITVFPAYQSLYQIAEAMGCELSPWRFELADSGWRLDLNWLSDHLSQRTRLLVLNFPHNPTGYLPAPDEFESILTLARRYGVYVFCDEMYRGLEYAAETRLAAAADEYERAISLSGLSKTYALPGLRLGWLATQENAILQSALAFKDYTTICHSAPSEILGLTALRSGPKIIQRNLSLIQANLLAAETFFSRHPQRFDWLLPSAGSVAFPRYLGPGTVEDFCTAALNQHGVMIVPGSIFDYPGDHFRVGLGRRNFSEALNQLEKIEL